MTPSQIVFAEPQRPEVVPRVEGRKRKWPKRVGKTLVVLAVLGVVAFGAWWGNRQVWFLGTDDGGRVSLYQGLPYDLPLGISLYTERKTLPIQVSTLAADDRDRATNHELRSEGDATSLIDNIAENVRIAEAKKRARALAIARAKAKTKKQQEKKKKQQQQKKKDAKNSKKSTGKATNGAADGPTP